MRKITVLALMTLLLMLSTLVAAATPSVDASGPKEQLQQTVEAILTVLRSDCPDEKQKNQEISALVRQRFDYQTMSQGVLGRNWMNTGEVDRSKFVALFSQLLEETYLGRIRSYKGQQIIYADAQIRQNRAEVDTFIKNDGVDIPVTYKLIPSESGWVVYDVVIEKVSLIRNYRSSYNDILRNKGMASLLEDMAVKLEELKARQEQPTQASV
ncbi:MAG: ABC transporter substrate-binding protein [Desulfuromonas sp.]|nr:ABC transporter substrate-binding protein [Desulfuromonas sp.]